MLGGRESRVRMMIELASEDGATTYFTSSLHSTYTIYTIMLYFSLLLQYRLDRPHCESCHKTVFQSVSR